MSAATCYRRRDMLVGQEIDQGNLGGKGRIEELAVC